MKKLLRKKKFWLLFAAGNLLPVCYVLWMCYGPPRAITISKETTWLTEPLTEDGRYVDYNEYLKKQIGTRDPRDDLWKALVGDEHPNFKSSEAAVALVPSVRYRNPGKELAPQTKDGYRRVNRDRERARQFAPFTNETDPEYAAVIRANESWYQAVMQTAPGPVGVEWSESNTSEIGLPITDVQQKLMDALRLRASLAFGSGDIETGIESVEFMLKIAERERSVPFLVNQGAGSRMMRRAIGNLCSGLLHSEAVPHAILHEWDKRCLTVDWNRWLEVIELYRLQALDFLQIAHRQRGSGDLFYPYRSEFGEPAASFCVNKVDFDAAMGEVNRSFDEAKLAFRIEDFRKSVKELLRIDKRIMTKWPSARVSQTKPTFRELVTENHTAWAVHESALVWFLAKHDRSRVVRNQNAWRRLRICIRLHVYRRKHGHWPETLDELLTLEGWEIDEAELLTDSYSQQPFKYGRMGDGFVIYSVGPDGVDNTNGKFPDRSDKIGWEHPGTDDQLWPWPDHRYQWHLKKQK